MKRVGLICSLVFLVVFLSISTYAQPVPGTYDSRDPDFPAGEWSETLVGGSEGAQGNVINARAVDYYSFGNGDAPALSDVILIGEPTTENRFYEYRTVYKGGALTLYNNASAGWHNEVDPAATSYVVNLGNTLVITKKYVDSGNALNGEIEFALFVVDANIEGYPGYTVTLTAKYDKGTPTIVPSSNPLTYGGPLSWAVITIKGPSPLQVPLDIKPGSCPNSFNLKSQGVLPAAILGTAELDIYTIDRASLRLKVGSQELIPVRFGVEDVAAPYTGDITGCESCTESKRDGYKDLTLKFKTQEIVEAIGEDNVDDEECFVVTVTGKLTDGTPITGEDVLRILKKGKGKGRP